MKRIELLIIFLFLSCSSFAQLVGKRATPIDSVQMVHIDSLKNGNTTPTYFGYGDTVIVEGVVMFDPHFYGQSSNRKATWLQDTNGKPFSGINIFLEPSQVSGMNLQQLNKATKFYENFQPGVMVKCMGVLANYPSGNVGNTQINLIDVASVHTNIIPQVISPLKLELDSFIKSDGQGGFVPKFETGEKYEGRYVEFSNLKVVDVSQNGSRFYWSVMDSKGNKIQIRDNSGYFRNDGKNDSIAPASYTFKKPIEGATVNYIRGIIVKSNSASGVTYQISPCLDSDLNISATAPIIENLSRNPIVPSSTDVDTICAKITDLDGNIVESKLFYSVGKGNGTFMSVLMTKGANDMYRGVIPKQPNGSFVNFYIKAVDNDGTIKHYPDTLATNSMYKVIDGGIQKIADIQENMFSNNQSIWINYSVPMSIEGIVSSTINQLGYVNIQDGINKFSGIFIRNSKNSTVLNNLKKGDRIKITSAKVIDNYGVTQLEDITDTDVSLISKGNTVYPPVNNLPVDSIQKKIINYSRAYQGMLLEFKNVYVVSQNPDAPKNFGEWSIGKDTNVTTSFIRVDDKSNSIESTFNVDSLKKNQKFSYIRGILYYSYGYYKLLPRDKNDIDGYKTVVGIDDNNKNDFFAKIYPNPAKDQLNIEISSEKTSNFEIEIFDVTGKRIEFLTHVMPNTNLYFDCRNYKEGFYIIKMSSDKSIITKNFLIVK